MFSGSKIAADLAGTADNCTCVPRESVHQELSSKYLLNGETAYIFLKSAKEDHIFTDQAYIVSKGNTAGGLKRTIYRVEYCDNPISNVMFETGGIGVTDQDCELKFTIASHNISIDIRKQDQELGVLYYRALSALAIEHSRKAKQFGLFKVFRNSVNLHVTEGAAGVKGVLDTIQASTLSDSLAAMDQLNAVSYLHVFEQYIR